MQNQNKRIILQIISFCKANKKFPRYFNSEGKFFAFKNQLYFSVFTERLNNEEIAAFKSAFSKRTL